MDSVGTFVVGAAVEVSFEDVFGVVLFEVAFVGVGVVMGSVNIKTYDILISSNTVQRCYKTFEK